MTRSLRDHSGANKTRRGNQHASAFTLVELVVVIFIIAITLALLGTRTGTFSYWKEEGFLRQLSETIIFLHHQAVTDQAFYRLGFDFDTHTYKVDVLKAEEEQASAELIALAQDAGSLSLELAAFSNPSIGETQVGIPPPSMPSLAEPIAFPTDVTIEDIRTMRGKVTPTSQDQAYILFSPRGFSEFAVLHLRMSSGQPVTILVNPFSGLTEIFREYKDFEWTYGREKKA